MIILAGRTLKLSPYFTHLDKRYEGIIRFGAETDTLDPEGAIIATAPPPERSAVEAILPQFVGNIMQTPPAYSALHIDGKRAHERAREGQTPEMPSRPVAIYALQLQSWTQLSDTAAEAKVCVHCSSGTYIRSLARDIALAAGSRGSLVALTRTQVGGFTLTEAFNPETFTTESFLPISKDIFKKLAIPCLDIDPNSAKVMRHGKPLREMSHLFAAIPPHASKVAFFCPESPSISPTPSPFIALIERPEGAEPDDSPNPSPTGWKYGFISN
jgi:tRNA pseudouridine55 synthase